jgi:D-tyrosyl-tRNA(Tyr) deacylase
VRALIQRVTEARVTVDGERIGEIGTGLCVLVGVTHGDDEKSATGLASKVAHLRVFDDDAGAMNRSLLDTGGAALVVSQFTLYGDTTRGRRPGWSAAAPPEVAEPLIETFGRELRALGVPVETGRFRADMQVTLVNDGPVTLMLEVTPGT